MTSRWIAPLCLLAFGVLLAGVWSYLSNLDRYVVDAPLTGPVDLTQSDDFFGTAYKERAAISRMRGPKTAGGPSLVEQAEAIARSLPMMADELDEASVRLRVQLSDQAPIQLTAALAEQHAGRHEAAIARFDGMLRSSPRQPAALSGKAACLAALGRREEAAACYREAARAAPRDTIIRYNYGVLLTRLGRFGEAADEFRAVVAIEPDHARAQYNRAALAQRAGRLIEAREAWLVFTELRPEAPGGWFNLGVTWMDFEEPLEAVRAFAAYALLAPDDPVGAANLATAYAAAGDSWTALEVLDAAEAAWPCDETVDSSRRDVLAQVSALHPADEDAAESFLARDDEGEWNLCGLLHAAYP